MTAPESREPEALLAEVSAIHDGCEMTFGREGATTCDGGLIPFGTYVSITHAQRLHVAAMQAAALESLIAGERAKAVEAIAREWQFGGWTILTPPVPAHANRVIALGQRVTDWLRERADREQA